MPLYVTRPPNPAVGTDWTATVPGQYLYDITGITATLATSAGPPATAADSSGFGNDLAYNNPDVQFGNPGYVAGDFMVTNIRAGSGYIAQGVMDTSGLPGTDLFFNVWTNRVKPAGTAPSFVAFAGALGFINFNISGTGTPAGSAAFTLSWSDGAGGSSISLVTPYPAGRHMVSVRYDLAANGGQFYIDGLPVGAFLFASGGIPDIEPTATLFIGGKNNGSPFPSYDEISVGTIAPTDADVAGLFAARGNFAAYTAAQIAIGPTWYYHLNETSVGVGRQVVLEITDGSDTVEAIPSGFAASTAAGPFAYSWQPKLGAGAQTAAGTVTTVPTPKLVLPAGYTIGSRTLDLGAFDQWSDIAIWWDSALMDALNGPGAYEYPPGVHLVYKQVTDAG